MYEVQASGFGVGRKVENCWSPGCVASSVVSYRRYSWVMHVGCTMRIMDRNVLNIDVQHDF